MTPADIRRLADTECDCITCKTVLACADLVEAVDKWQAYYGPKVDEAVVDAFQRIEALRA